jgi:hypothetical protein
MIRPLFVIAFLTGIWGVMACQGSGAAAEVPKARPGDVAIAEELDAARKAGTVDAYRLFIARHPHHPLAEIARNELAEIERHHRH